MSEKGQTRIQKYLSEVGFCSRSQAERYIRAGRIAVNGQKAVLGDKASGKDTIALDGQKIQVKKQPRKKVIVFNKPAGVECTLVQNPWVKSLMNFDFGGDRVFPIGRLDIDTHGLLLLTNDGELGNRLARSSKKHDEEYLLVAQDKVTPEMLESFRSGLEGENSISPPYCAEQPQDNALKIILHEGRCKYIRRLCDAAGIKILDLQRVRVGVHELGELKAGSWRVLSENEFDALKEGKVVTPGRRRIVPSKR